VLSVNPALCSIFGRVRSELVGQNVAILLPPPFSTMHDTWLTNFLTGRTVTQVVDRTRRVFGLHKNGTIFPMALTVKQVSGGLAKSRFLAMVSAEVVPRTEHFLLVKGSTGTIIRCSGGCYPLLGITQAELGDRSAARIARFLPNVDLSADSGLGTQITKLHTDLTRFSGEVIKTTVYFKTFGLQLKDVVMVKIVEHVAPDAAKRQSEERFELEDGLSLNEDSHSNQAVIDNGGMFTVNEAEEEDDQDTSDADVGGADAEYKAPIEITVEDCAGAAHSETTAALDHATPAVSTDVAPARVVSPASRMHALLMSDPVVSGDHRTAAAEVPSIGLGVGSATTPSRRPVRSVPSTPQGVTRGSLATPGRATGEITRRRLASATAEDGRSVHAASVHGGASVTSSTRTSKCAYAVVTVLARHKSNGGICCNELCGYPMAHRHLCSLYLQQAPLVTPPP